jgi:glycosyltransferase involved in cell wall biosynthesis
VTARRPFLFLSANTPWVYALAHRLGADGPVQAVRVFDWGVYYGQRPTWPPGPPSARLTRTTRLMPTGYTGLLEPLVRPFAQWFVRRWSRALQAEGGGAAPVVVAPYPYLAPWVRRVPGHRLVYYNLDDYVLYRPARAATITAQEDELVRRAHRTVCLSQHQVEALRARHPRHADRIHHFPLGVTEAFLNPAPGAPPAPRTVGYVGNLSDRVDWPLVNATAARCPDLTFRFVGGADPDARATPWERARAEAFRRPNVDYVGRVPQADVTTHYWSFAVNWIPYDAAHPFNRASCPTKIMDGLGSGRPMVSTPVPECALYPDWIRLAATPGAMAEALHAARTQATPARAAAQVAFARRHTWTHRAATFRRLLDAAPAAAPAPTPAPRDA